MSDWAFFILIGVLLHKFLSTGDSPSYSEFVHGLFFMLISGWHQQSKLKFWIHPRYDHIVPIIELPIHHQCSSSLNTIPSHHSSFIHVLQNDCWSNEEEKPFPLKYQGRRQMWFKVRAKSNITQASVTKKCFFPSNPYQKTGFKEKGKYSKSNELIQVNQGNIKERLQESLHS